MHQSNIPCVYIFRLLVRLIGVALPKSNTLAWLIVIVMFNSNISIFAVADPRIKNSGLFCGPDSSPPDSTLGFVQVMESLSQQLNTNDWGTQSIANSTPPTYGLFQCFEDLSPTDCLLCYAAARTAIPRCLPAAARLFLDGCFLRYDDYNFYNESVGGSDAVNCTTSLGDWDGDKNGGTSLQFNESVGVLVDNLTDVALQNGGFGVLEGKGVYGLAQCWKSLSAEGCRQCLEKAGKEVKGCVPSKEGRGLNAGCYLRYSTVKFYNDAPPKNHSSGVYTTGAKVGIGMSAVAFLVLLVFAVYAAYLRFSNNKQGHKNLRKFSLSFNKPSLHFKYETLEKATNYFDLSRKLGEGGAGSVFKGILPNGEIVAVKRLVFTTRNWVDEFFNEVNLISGIQHKNLVKLLGCSIEGPESLLVYEYLPNRSLDQFLFDKEKLKLLNWKKRVDIIVGTAEGIAYLHGGSGTRIIHRDIKSSNVLLDEDLTPKIADFGLARDFGTDRSHLSTGIAGTLGYMAPEYIVRGQLTEKADVYSFGVLVLETICGRKNNASLENAGSLLQRVWNLYKSGKLLESVDPSLNSKFPEKEAMEVLQIGLLCTQASAALRPSMDEVVQMLTNKEREIGTPNQPPFLSFRSLDTVTTTRSNRVHGLTPSGSTIIELSSHTSSGSSVMPTSDEHSRSEDSEVLTRSRF